MSNSEPNENILATGNIRQLMIKFAVPSIIAMMVTSIYNVVDQLFIGNYVGTNGNAATNIAFPLSMTCTAVALLFGLGGASGFNLTMGAGEKKKAPYYVGNATTMIIGVGVALCLITEIFLTPMLKGFGSPAEVLPFAKDYVRVAAIGFPFMVFTIGGGHLIRADGKPKISMICNLSGAVINIGLDALFVVTFDMGMTGAAAATVIGQVFSAGLAMYFLIHYKTVKLQRMHFKLETDYTLRIIGLGAGAFFNQIAMMVVQIALNHLLKYYGSLSEYGQAVPIACAGIGTKVNMLYMAIIIGLAQGTQPIESFNYGARNYSRVQKAYVLALSTGACVSVVAFVLFHFFPRQILKLFADGTETEGYYTFGISYFKIFLMCTFFNCLQPVTSTFFTSIGKAYKGAFLSLTRQIIFLLPLLIVMPVFMGIDGLLYAAPIADGLSFVTAGVMVIMEFKAMVRLNSSNAIKG